ncbi:MAG: 50S ribosomal protein L10 [Deltaproteobacteria bacterium RBG_16_49_23]|nr:MAG: 50S ribosomal protein L10 [Deltaproteobacteria bacterium RBG_16_49_23]
MNRNEKRQVVTDFSKKIEGFQAAILTHYRGLNVDQINTLRRRLRGEKISYHVVKNTVMKLAAKGTDLEKLADYFKGPTAIAISYDDPVSLAKILSEFVKTQPKLEIKIGLVQGQVIAPDEIKTLATMPSREILLAQILGGIQVPGQELAGVIMNGLQQVVGVIQARADQLGESESGK